MVSTALLAIDFSPSGPPLWTYSIPGTEVAYGIRPLVIEIDGRLVTLAVTNFTSAAPETRLANGSREARFTGEVAGHEGLTLTLVIRYREESPIIRFRYEIASRTERRLTKASGTDSLQYLSLSLESRSRGTEIRFSDFNELYHSFTLVESPLEDRHFSNGVSFMGPMLVAEGPTNSMLLAYEHGSQFPDRFLEFVPSTRSEGAPARLPNADREVTVRAVKGNYYDGQPLSGVPYRTVWFQLGAVTGSVELLREDYREFQIHGATTNRESRKPYICYNTWNYQERNQDWNGKSYLDSMTQVRMLAEIDAAHAMGIDVFVLDTGWYEKTGDWRVSKARFPNELKDVKAKLDGYGMKLGLWFNPTVAAVSSKMLTEHEDCIRSHDGVRGEPHAIWETEESHGMCLVSRYADAFADELIRLHGELGVTYFKWDAIGQYGCSDPGHDHGTASNSPRERDDCYAFSIGRAMAHVVDRLCAACPDAIVDFDITEGGRAVGLEFLAAGKYFLINNGPYYGNYNIPAPAGRNVNMFFFPGPARGWICRSPLNYDRWFPSVLFLTHYLPDDPAENQWICLASLVLGQNGIWGDLLAVSPEGVKRFGETLSRYKRIRDDITAALPVRSGAVGSNPEIHEKIAGNGRGVVCLFASARGNYTYVTQHPVDRQSWHSDGVTVAFDRQGRAVITAAIDKPSAAIVMFGVKA